MKKVCFPFLDAIKNMKKKKYNFRKLKSMKTISAKKDPDLYIKTEKALDNYKNDSQEDQVNSVRCKAFSFLIYVLSTFGRGSW